jgi:hypothetical protein
MRSGRVILAGLASGIMTACAPQGSPSVYKVLGPRAEPLRTAFNANVGKVRVIMLVAPT